MGGERKREKEGGREIYFKRLAHTIVGAGRMAGWRPKEELMLQLKSVRSSGGRILSCSEKSVLFLQLTGGKAHPLMEGNLLDSKFTNLNVNPSKAHLRRDT